jgi:hypothetical protein|tara:strand:+ start:15 stop:164 length:150 start_codon:yes stop_codon:yes gene_type:complete
MNLKISGIFLGHLFYETKNSFFGFADSDFLIGPARPASAACIFMHRPMP